MTQPVVTVEMDTSLSVIKDIFDNTHFHHLLVEFENKLVGVISDRDLLRAISHRVDTVAATATDMASLNKRAHQIMTRNLVTLFDSDNVKDAVRLFNLHRVSCLPVVDNTHKPVGIVSWRDILHEMGKRFD